MKPIKSALLVMALMTSSSVSAQSTQNSIYIDQIGDNAAVTITQQGQGNEIGNTTTQKPLTVQGTGQTVTVTQTGNNNKINGDVKQSDNSTTTVNTTGDSNQLQLDVGNSGDTSGSTTSTTVEGSSNDITINQGKVSAATNLNQTMTVTGDLNTITQNIETNDVTNTIALQGDSNVLNTTQNGQSGKNIDLSVTGSQNLFNINQKSTLNVDSIQINSVGNGGTWNINQCNAGDC